MNYNDFQTDLEYSLLARENELFDLFYWRVFPGLARIELVEDRKLQRQGIDKLLHMDNGQRITIDEKKRRTDYGDILLELWSVFEEGKKGWLFTSYCHYLVYAIMPTQKVYLLPMALLRLAWEHNKVEWEQHYRRIEAHNVNYKTISIPIPPSILLLAISKEMSHQLVGVVS